MEQLIREKWSEIKDIMNKEYNLSPISFKTCVDKIMAQLTKSQLSHLCNCYCRQPNKSGFYLEQIFRSFNMNTRNPGFVQC